MKKDTVELSNGKIMDDYFYMDIGQAVMVVPATKEGELVMVRQYKHGGGEIVIEFPAGNIENKENSFLEAAKRELLEETGYASKEWEQCGVLINSPSKSAQKIRVYLAKNAEKISEQNLDEAEEIEVLKISKSDFFKMIGTGEINASDTIASYLMAFSSGE